MPQGISAATPKADECTPDVATRTAFAAIRSFDAGVPESVLSIDSRRSNSATLSSSRARLIGHDPQACSTGGFGAER